MNATPIQQMANKRFQRFLENGTGEKSSIPQNTHRGMQYVSESANHHAGNLFGINSRLYVS
jgi:hypothetical protein